MVNAKLVVPAGALDHWSAGEIPKLSQVYNLGNRPLFVKPLPEKVNWLAIRLLLVAVLVELELLLQPKMVNPIIK